MFVDGFEAQFFPNPGQNLPEVTADVQTVNDTMTQNIFFTKSGTIQFLIKNYQKGKPPEKTQSPTQC